MMQMEMLNVAELLHSGPREEVVFEGSKSNLFNFTLHVVHARHTWYSKRLDSLTGCIPGDWSIFLMLVLQHYLVTPHAVRNYNWAVVLGWRVRGGATNYVHSARSWTSAHGMSIASLGMAFSHPEVARHGGFCSMCRQFALIDQDYWTCRSGSSGQRIGQVLSIHVFSGRQSQMMSSGNWITIFDS
jgi:hypothetical protein